METKTTPRPICKTIVVRKDNRIVGYWHVEDFKVRKHTVPLYDEHVEQALVKTEEWFMKKAAPGHELTIESVYLESEVVKAVNGFDELAKLKITQERNVNRLDYLNAENERLKDQIITGALIPIDITRLQVENKRLRDALEGLTDILNNHYGDDPDETPLIDAAFEALKTK